MSDSASEDAGAAVPLAGTIESANRSRTSGSEGEPYPGASRPGTFREWFRRVAPRLERFIVHNVLHLDDTPHRIALGVFLGFVVGASPTLGLQMLIYFALAAVLRANKISGLGPIWITNPLTAVPIYYANWRLGSLLMTGRLETSEKSREAIARLVEGGPGSELGFFERLLSSEFWSAAWDAFGRIGFELWVGSLFIGVLTGLVGYVLTRRAVAGYRHRHPPRHPIV